MIITPELLTCAEFPIPLDVMPIDGRNWLLKSIPEFLWNIIFPTAFPRAFFRHDDDYTKGDCTKHEADSRLQRLMDVEANLYLKLRDLCIADSSAFIPDEPLSTAKRWEIYEGVNLGGFRAWNDHRKNDPK